MTEVGWYYSESNIRTIGDHPRMIAFLDENSYGAPPRIYILTTDSVHELPCSWIVA